MTVSKGEIVQLKDGATPLFVRTHVQAVEGLADIDVKFANKQDKIYMNETTPVGTNGWSVSSGKISRLGDVVIVNARVSGKVSSYYAPILTLPKWAGAKDGGKEFPSLAYDANGGRIAGTVVATDSNVVWSLGGNSTTAIIFCVYKGVAL